MKQPVKRNTIEIDAAGRAVGRVATEAAKYLRGKNKPTFQENLDEGDTVVVINASKVIFTGKKFVQKDFRHHSMHPGGLKVVAMKKVFEEDPAKVIRHAVNGMLPKNSFRTEMMKRLIVKA